MNPEWMQLSRTELAKEVSPSQWNPTKTPDEVIQEYLTTSADYTAAARAAVPHQLDIPYGTQPAQVFDLYGTNLGIRAPVFVFIHGGYWQEGSKDISGGISMLNYKIGIKTLVFGYTLAPEAKVSEMETGLVDAIQVLFKGHADPGRKLIIGGHSAGAQLASSLLHSPNLDPIIGRSIVGLVLISGVFDLRPLLLTYVNDSLNFSQNEAVASSPLFLPFNNVIDFGFLRTLILIGEHDSPEFHRQSFAYLQQLRTQTPLANRTSFYSSASDDHFTIVQNLAQESSSVYQVMKAFLKPFISTA